MRDGNHATHARYRLVVVRSGGARSGAQAPLVCGERGRGARHGRRETLDAAVQADPGHRHAAAALLGRPEEDEGHRQGLYNPWDQERFGVEEPLHRVSLNKLQRRFIDLVKVQPKLANTRVRFITNSFGLVNYAFEGAPTERETEHTELAFACAQAVLHPPSPAEIAGRANESDGEVQVCRTRGPDHDSPMAYGVHRRHGDTSPGPARGATDAVKFMRAASAYRHEGRITVA